MSATLRITYQSINKHTCHMDYVSSNSIYMYMYMYVMCMYNLVVNQIRPILMIANLSPPYHIPLISSHGWPLFSPWSTAPNWVLLKQMNPYLHWSPTTLSSHMISLPSPNKDKLCMPINFCHLVLPDYGKGHYTHKHGRKPFSLAWSMTDVNIR